MVLCSKPQSFQKQILRFTDILKLTRTVRRERGKLKCNAYQFGRWNRVSFLWARCQAPARHLSYSARPYCPTDRRRVRRFVVLSSFPSRRWPLPSRRWPRPFSVETRNLWRRRTWAWTMYRPWRCLMPRPLRPRSALIQGRTLRRREALKWV